MEDLQVSKVGSARIVRADAHNIAVEILREIENTEKGSDGKRVKTGTTRSEWVEAGYYGGNLQWAAESALYQAMPEGEVITPQMIKDAVAEIVRQTKAVIE